MKPIHHLTARLLLCLAALLTVTACQDDYIEKNAGLTGDSDKTTLRLIVPMTRTVPDKETDNGKLTDNPDVSSEGYIRNLWLLAYPVGDEGDVLVKRLDSSTTNLTHDYKPFDIEIKLGTYHMYVVANVDGITSTTTEDDLKDIILSYKSGENGIALPDPAAGLPMVCEYQDIKLAESGESVDKTNGGNVEIKFNETTTVYADLTFVCVKVRYTLVFDNSTNGVSKAFNESSAENQYINNIVRIDGIQAVKIPEGAPLLIHPEANYTTATATGNITQNGEPVFTAKVIGNNYYFNTSGSAFTSSSSDYDTFEYTAAFDNTQASSYAYRGTLYLPEHYVTKATQANQTELHISATLLSQSEAGGSYVGRATLKYTIELGDTQEQEDQTNEADKVRQLPRGRYYDIIARITGVGEELEMTAAVQDWTPATVAAELNGPYFLQVEKTEGVEVTAGQSTVVNCSTDAPILTCESPKYTLENGEVIDIYKVKFQQNEAGEYTSFTVTVNPEMPAVENASSNDAIEKYIYIVANTIGANDELKEGLKKKINITPALDPYLVVTPSNYTIYMKEVANQESYSVPFTYETNLKNIKITKDEAANHTHIDYSFAFEEEPKEYSWGTSVDFPEGIGTLTCKLKETHNQQSFPQNETITFTYEATGNVLKTNGATEEKTITKRTTLQIIPNATTYRLYFRSVSDDWAEPHIYVYEPLYTSSDMTPSNELVFITGGGGSKENDFFAGENALLYSFTGKRTFNGWNTQNGNVELIGPREIRDGQFYWNGPKDSYKNMIYETYYDENEHVTRYNPTTDGLLNMTTDCYNHSIDYCADIRNAGTCASCKSDDHYNAKWPGVRMVDATDIGHPGWFYYDLPLLAEPGKALIMFADGHSGPQNWQNDTETKKRRYPSHMTPGIPLYNFADKEGWFAYDYTKGDNNEFVDDKPYIAPSTMYKYKIWTYNGANNIHLWGNDDNKAYNTEWPGTTLNIAEDGGKYILLTSESKITYVLNYSVGDGDKSIQVNDWQEIDEHNFQYGYQYQRTFPVPSTFRIWISNTSKTKIHLWNASGQFYKPWDDEQERILTDSEGKRYYDFTTSAEWNFTSPLNYKFTDDNDDSSIDTNDENVCKSVTGKEYDYEIYL